MTFENERPCLNSSRTLSEHVVGVVGISHHTAPVAVREQFAVTASDAPAALRRLSERFGGAAILSTCNRSEVYLTAPTAIWRERQCADTVARTWGGVLPESGFYHHVGMNAARHLFRVAAGIDSLVLGEAEVLGQVRAALRTASTAGTSNQVIERLFQAALRCGRRARTQTAIGRRPMSVSSVAAALAGRALGSLAGKRVVVIGAGDAGRLAARAMKDAGAKEILIVNRSRERAQAVAAGLGARAVAFGSLFDSLVTADVVIAATSSGGYVLRENAVAEAMSRRRGHPIVLVDVAVPRDIEPSVRRHDGVSLYDMDDLDRAADENRRRRQSEVSAVESLIEDELERFGGWFESLSVVPTISAIREKAEAARRRELERTLARMQDLSETDRRRVAAMSRALVKRILHEPFVRLREDASSHRHLATARHLFALESTDPSRQRE